MTVTFDVSADFDVFDNTELVSFQTLGSAGVLTTVATCVKALRRSLNRNTATALGSASLMQNAITWNLDATDMPGVNPKLGDRVVDASGVNYVIEIAEYQTWQNRWRLTTRRTK